jgi:hypothetical protein
MQINLGPNTLGNLFLIQERTISVPTFQRNYSWEAEQIDTFLTDLVDSATSEEKKHFFGPLVILEKAGETKRMLVDGQQRTTTAVMSMAILRDYLVSDLDGDTMVGDEYQQWDLLQHLNTYLFETSIPGQPRFESNYHLKDVFRFWVLEHPKSKNRKFLSKAGAGMNGQEVKLTKELRAAYLRLKSGVSNFIDTGTVEASGSEVGKASAEVRKKRAESLLTALTGGFEIHSMVLNSEADAFILFETLNDRGLKLSPADLLKTLIMSDVLEKHGTSALDFVLGKWDSVLDYIDDVPFSKFLRHYLLTVEPKPVQTRRIFGIFKRMLREESGKLSTIDQVTLLSDASQAYGRLLKESPFARINEFSETHRVLLMKALIGKVDLKGNSADLLARATEALAYRWIAGGGNAQKLEKLYQKWCQDDEFFASAEGVKSLVSQMLDAMPNDVDFRSTLETLDSEPMAKFLLRRLEQSLGSKGAWGDNLSLEHLAPQNPNEASKEWFERVPVLNLDGVEITYKRQIASLGNLALLERGWNSAISNHVWDRKRGVGEERDGYRGYAASQVLQIKPLAKMSEWTGATIEKRTAYLVEQGLKLFSKDWVLTGKTSAEEFKA